MAAEWLRERRKELHLSQEELAARLQVRGFDLTPGAISHWENGRNIMPIEQTDFRQALAASLNLSVRELLKRAGYEVLRTARTDEAEIAAEIIDQLDSEHRKLALRL